MNDQRPLLFVSGDFPPASGGEARFASGLVRADRDGHLVVLVPHLAEPPGGGHSLLVRRYLPLGTKPLNRILRVLAMTVYVLCETRGRKPVAVVAFQPLLAGPGGLVARRLFGTRLVVFFHGGDFLEYVKHPLLRPLVLALLRQAEVVVANSSKTAALLAEWEPRVRDRLAVLNPPFVMPRIKAGARPSPEVGALLRRLAGKKVLLTVGRLIPTKGHRRVLDVLTFLDSSFHYLIVGEGPDRIGLEEELRRRGLQERVTLTGYLQDEELPALYRIALVFLLLSERSETWIEGFGMVLLEAAAHGVPVIASVDGGSGDALVDGENGYLVAPTDVPRIVALVRELDESPRLRQRLGQRGRRLVEERHTPEAVLASLKDLAHGV